MSIVRFRKYSGFHFIHSKSHRQKCGSTQSHLMTYNDGRNHCHNMLSEYHYTTAIKKQQQQQQIKNFWLDVVPLEMFTWQFRRFRFAAVGIHFLKRKKNSHPFNGLFLTIRIHCDLHWFVRIINPLTMFTSCYANNLEF